MLVVDLGKWMNKTLINWGIDPAVADRFDETIMALLMIVVAIVLNYLCQAILIGGMKQYTRRKPHQWNTLLMKRRVFHNLIHTIPAFLVYSLLPMAFIRGKELLLISQKACVIYIIFSLLLAINGILLMIMDIYDGRESMKDRPMKGFIQVLQVLLFFVGGIVIIAIIVNKSPATLFAGLGASAAILMLVFKDSILGFVAVFDIDGTLAWQDPRVAQELPESERDLSPYPNEAVSQAIRDFVAKGNMAFICTGRTLSCIHPKLLELPWTGIVCLAGGYVELEGHVIRDLAMTPGMLQRLAPILEQSDEVIRFEGLNGVVRMSADAPDAPGYARTVGDAITQLQHYSAYKILMSTSLANRIAQDQAFEPLLCFNELELEVTEISPRECTKREGIQSVLDALDPHHGTVYGIGDASNDVSLMNAVDVGIAMGNAPDFLKEKADYVTDSIDHDGVVTALEHFGLI